jgi:cytoskeletal protein CcmA (bactofilin family)
MSIPSDISRDKVSILGPTLKFNGELSADEDLVIHGEVEGTIGLTPRVTVGQEARIKAGIHAERIVVEGSVDGNLEADAAVVIRESAVVNGDIKAPNVSILEGARFNGAVAMAARRAE